MSTTTVPTEPTEAMELKLLIAHTIIEDLRVRHPGLEQIDNERSDLWLPGGSTPQSSGCIVDIHSVAAAVAAEIESEVVKSAYQRGWNDRESDILERAERILPSAAAPVPSPHGKELREAIVDLIDGNEAYRANVMDENSIWLAGILTDAILALLAPARSGWRPLHDLTPDGRTILLTSATWGGGAVTREWVSTGRQMKDLYNWSDPPTHYMEIQPLPVAPSEGVEP